MKTLENFVVFTLSTETTTETNGGRRSYAELRRRRLAARRRRAVATTPIERTKAKCDASRSPNDEYLSNAAAAFINAFNQG